MHEWLLRLTRPEDQLLWIWVAIAVGHGALGVVLGGLVRRPSGRLREPGVGRSSR